MVDFGDKYFNEGNLGKAIKCYQDSFDLFLKYVPNSSTIKQYKKIVAIPCALMFCHIYQNNFEKANYYLKYSFFYNPTLLDSEIPYLKNVNQLLLQKDPFQNIQSDKADLKTIFQHLRKQFLLYISSEKIKEDNFLEINILLEFICKIQTNSLLSKLENKENWIFEIFFESQNKNFDHLGELSSQGGKNSVNSQRNTLSKVRFKEFISLTSAQIIGNISRFLPLKSKKIQSKSYENCFIGKNTFSITTTYESCFKKGRDCLNFMIEKKIFVSKIESIDFFEMMIGFGVISEINNESKYHPDSLYYFKMMPVKNIIKEGYLMKKGQVKCKKKYFKKSKKKSTIFFREQEMDLPLFKHDHLLLKRKR